MEALLLEPELLHNLDNVRLELARPSNAGGRIPSLLIYSWYFLRYVDNKNKDELVSREKADKYLPVDMYIGGVEHARYCIFCIPVSIPNSYMISE